MKNRIYEYDCIRFLAIISVVIGHSCYVSIGYTAYPPPDNTAPLYTNLFFSILRQMSGFVYTFHMPLFFILSGAVFALYVFKLKFSISRIGQ